MLRLAKLTDAEYVLDQVAGGLEDYYLGSGEAPGVWFGRLADQLGLAGTVIADDLRALIDRRHPATGAILGGAKQPTVRAIDATFSAPKSVSLLWAFGTPEAASVVSIAHVEAVAAALDFVESRAAVTRRQHARQRQRVATTGWAAATFVHRISRAGDPQLHTGREGEGRAGGDKERTGEEERRGDGARKGYRSGAKEGREGRKGPADAPSCQGLR